MKQTNVHSFLLMARLGSLDDSINIAVFEGDGKIPHFHLFKGENPPDATWHTSICFTESIYYPHYGEMKKLIDTEVSALISFFSSQKRWIPTITNWQYALAAWNSNNSEHSIYMNTKMPDYLLLSNR